MENRALTLEEIYKINEYKVYAKDNSVDCNVSRMFNTFQYQARKNHSDWGFNKRYDWSMEQIKQTIDGMLKTKEGKWEKKGLKTEKFIYLSFFKVFYGD